MSVEDFERLKADFEEAKQKEKAYFKQIVAANNVLRRMPQTAVEKIAFNMNRLTEVLGKFGEVKDPLRLVDGQKKLGDYVR